MTGDGVGDAIIEASRTSNARALHVLAVVFGMLERACKRAQPLTPTSNQEGRLRPALYF